MSKVLIVGGSSGIGLATAQLFAKNNHQVTIVSRNAAQLNLPNLTGINLDFMDETAINRFFETHADFDYEFKFK